MTVQNPAMDAGANRGAHPAGLTPELVAELEKDHSKVAQLSEEQLRALLEDEDEPGTPPAAPTSAPQAPVAPGAPAPAAQAPSAPAPVREETPSSGAVDGEEHKRKLNELNTVRQQLQTRERELEALRKQAKEDEDRAAAIAASAATRKTLNDEGFVETTEERVARLERELQAMAQGNATVLKTKAEEAEGELKKARVQREYLEIETFQMSSPRFGADLRTKRPFRDLDADIGRLEATLGKDNVALMQKDKSFREQMEAKGYKLPEEWEKWQTILHLHKFKSGANSLQQAYPSYASAFTDFAQESGFLERAVRDASLEAARETAEKLVNRSTETSVLPADSGSGGGAHTVSNSKWTAETAALWMRNHPNPKTDEERAIQHEILDWIEKNDV